MKTEMQEPVDEAAVAELAKRIPVRHIPRLLVYLSARLLTEDTGPENYPGKLQEGLQTARLLTARELAHHLNLPESWIRDQQRSGRIPSIRAGKYVRFNLTEVQRALAQNRAGET
jgi:excisionase family DNA binding protein